MRKELQKDFTKDGMRIANKHTKRCSSLLIIREMQVKNVFDKGAEVFQ